MPGGVLDGDDVVPAAGAADVVKPKGPSGEDLIWCHPVPFYLPDVQRYEPDDSLFDIRVNRSNGVPEGDPLVPMNKDRVGGGKFLMNIGG